MKLIVEIPDKSINMAKTVMMTGCDNEEQTDELNEACERLKARTEPMVIDYTEAEYKMFEKELRQMYLAFATLAISAMKMKEMNAKKEV